MWVLYALLAALTAGMVNILSKAGFKNTDSSLAFAIESVLILLVTWTVILFQGTIGKMGQITKKEWLFLIAAGILTALSSLFTFRALKLGEVSTVTPIERASLIFSIIFAAIFLKERITWQIVVGGVMILGGVILISVSQKAS